MIVSTGLGATSNQIVGNISSAGGLIPVVGPLVQLAGTIYNLFHNPLTAQQKVASSNDANQVEQLMKQNVAAWQSSDKSCASQQQALSNYDQLFARLVQLCGQVGGTPGTACIADREGVRNGGNGKFDWYAYYRDPIANDQCVGSTVLNSVQSLLNGTSFTGSGIDPTMLLIGGGGLLVVILLMSSSGK